jgi:hypothetical protein
MANQIQLGNRTFAIGDPGVPRQGILLGAGGGFLQRFSDFVALPDGSVNFLTYLTEGGGPIPQDHNAAALLQLGKTEFFTERERELNRIGFKTMESPRISSETVEYLLLIQETDLYGMMWNDGGRGDLPEPLRLFVEDMREALSRRFEEEHGS